MTERTEDRGTISPSLRSGIGAFVAMDFMRDASARQAAGEDIIHMEVGQPGTPAPRLVREAAMKEMAGAALGYTDALGHPALRERIAGNRDTYGLDIAPSRIVVTTGVFSWVHPRLSCPARSGRRDRASHARLSCTGKLPRCLASGRLFARTRGKPLRAPSQRTCA